MRQKAEHATVVGLWPAVCIVTVPVANKARVVVSSVSVQFRVIDVEALLDEATKPPLDVTVVGPEGWNAGKVCMAVN